MKQITLGMTWDRDGHTFTVTKIFKNGKVQITETWISEDTWKDCKQVANYHVDEDENGQFVWQDEYKEYAFNEKEENGYSWWARMYAVGADHTPQMEEQITTNNNSKEEMNMKNATKGAQVEVMDFELNGVRYTNTRPGYYYKKENGKQVRISKAEWDAAWEASGEAEKQAREAKAAESDKEAEKAMKKAEKKPRKSKDIAHESNGVTLTEKQVDFIKHVPDTCFYEHGLESTMWVDVLADEIGGQFAGKPMTVGAMISTLREKEVIYVAVDKVNGKKTKFFGFTELGRKIAAELGLN